MTDSVLTALMSGSHWNGLMSDSASNATRIGLERSAWRSDSASIAWLIAEVLNATARATSVGARFAVGLSETVWLVLAMIRFLSYETVASSDSVSACLDPGVRHYERIVQGLSTVYDDLATA